MPAPRPLRWTSTCPAMLPLVAVPATDPPRANLAEHAYACGLQAGDWTISPVAAGGDQLL